MMKVSVCITAYNHEKYIAQALDSVLMQKTTFEYEIIIGEDDSKDNTRNIVKKYKENYPDKIKLFLNDRKNVIYIDGKPTGRWNLINNLKNARGQYIALLDGDDYWTDPNKLQIQIDFLDAHLEHTICFHDVFVEKENALAQGLVFPGVVPLSFQYLIETNFIPTCSVVYRKILDFNKLPEWFYFSVPMADWPLHILHAHNGKIGKIDKVMAVYREHDQGSWAIPRTNIEIRNKYANITLFCFLEHFKCDIISVDYIRKVIFKNNIMIMMEMLLSKHYMRLLNYYRHNCLYYRANDYLVFLFSFVATLFKGKITYVSRLQDLIPKIFRMFGFS